MAPVVAAGGLAVGVVESLDSNEEATTRVSEGRGGRAKGGKSQGSNEGAAVDDGLVEVSDNRHGLAQYSRAPGVVAESLRGIHLLAAAVVTLAPAAAEVAAVPVGAPGDLGALSVMTLAVTGAMVVATSSFLAPTTGGMAVPKALIANGERSPEERCGPKKSSPERGTSVGAEMRKKEAGGV